MDERARRQEETRDRIRDAVLSLLEEDGPTAVTVAEVARRARVQRLTVYKHFPDRDLLLAGGTEHAVNRNPPPDPDGWGAVANPAVRLRAALFQAHLWYAQEQERLARSAGLEDEAMAAWERRAAESLRETEGLDDAGRARRDAALGLAFSFAAWQQLIRRQGLPEAQAVEVLARTVEAAARG